MAVFHCLARNVWSFLQIDSSVFQYKSELVSQFSAHALPRFAGGTLRVIVDRVFPLRDVGEAHRVMESNVTTGKLVLEVRKEAGDHSEL